MSLLQTFLRPGRALASLKRKQLASISLVLLFAFVLGALERSSLAYGQIAKKAPVAKASQAKVGELAPIAPFVNDQTLFVFRVDVNKINIDRLGDTIEALFAQTTTQLGFDEESIKATSAEFSKTVAALKAQGKESLADFNKTSGGVSQLYYVVQSTKAEGACFIIPTANADESVVDDLVTVFKDRMGLNCAVYQKNYVVASSLPLKEIGAYYRNFTPGTNAKAESYFKANSDKVGVFYCNRFKIRALAPILLADAFKNLAESDPDEAKTPTLLADASTVESGKAHIAQSEATNARGTFLQGGSFGQKTSKKKSVDPFENAPRSIKDAIEVFDTSFAEAYGYVDLSGLRASATLKFSSPINAEKFRKTLGGIIDEVVPVYFESLELILQNLEKVNASDSKMELPALGSFPLETIKKYRLIPLARELTAGEARPHLPTQNREELVFDYNAASELKKLGPYTIGVLALSISGAATANSVAEIEAETEDLDSVFEEVDSESQSDSSPFEEVDESSDNSESPFKEVDDSKSND